MATDRRRTDTVAENYSFSVILEPQEGGGFTVLVPALPEVITEGDSEHEALANAEEAIRAILEYRRDSGVPIPAEADPQIRGIALAAQRPPLAPSRRAFGRRVGRQGDPRVTRLLPHRDRRCGEFRVCEVADGNGDVSGKAFALPIDR